MALQGSDSHDPVRLDEEPKELPQPLASRQVYDARRPDSARRSNAVVQFLDNLAGELARPSPLHSNAELLNRIDGTLNDVKDDFKRIRQDQHEQKIHIRGAETVELTETYLLLTNEENKRQLGSLWEPLWQKYELVSVMWDRQRDWQAFEARLSDVDARIMQLLPEMRRPCRVSEDLARTVPELGPFVGKLVEFVVRQ